MDPTGFPSCDSGGIGPVPRPTTVSPGLPWWINAGFVGTLVYNSSLWGTAAARELVDLSFLPFEFTDVNAGSAWVLDNATKAARVVTHVRAIPTDGAYGATVMVNSIPYTSLIKDYALVFEADLPAPSTARVLVSGLNILGGNGLPSAGPGRWIFDTLLRHALSSPARHRGATGSSANPAARKPDGAVFAGAAAPPSTAFCTGPASFCPAGAESACTRPFASFTPGPCGKNFAIVQPVSLAAAANVTALKIKLQAKAAGTRVIPLLYDGASGAPGRLIANGTAVPLTAGHAPAWLSLPLEAPSLPPGRYYIGALYSADTSCWAGEEGARDSFAAQPFAAGPLPGTGLSWTSGTEGIATYAVTA